MIEELALVRIKDFPSDKYFWGYRSSSGVWHYEEIGSNGHFRARDIGEHQFDYENQQRIFPVIIRGPRAIELYKLFHG